MDLKTVSVFAVLTIGSVTVASAQSQPAPLPTPAPAQAVKMADALAKNLDAFAGREATRGEREQAYTKLLEGQRYIWTASRLRTQAGVTNANRSARQAFEKAVDLDPRLAEGYTALAELAISTPPGDINEGIALASIAVKLQPNNFGSHRILARLFTFKSRMNSENPDRSFFDRAVAEWKEVARLDPRSAEAWAFLSALYEKTDRVPEQIEALKRWLASAPSVDSQFYRGFMGSEANLAPEAASLQLGPALLKAGRTKEAIETLSVAVADDPENYAALDLLREAIESANGETAAIATDALQQAVYANQGNVSLISLLARVESRSGKLDEAVKLLNDSSRKLLAADRPSASVLKVLLGDLLNGEHRPADALKAYEESLSDRGLDQAMNLSEDEREFAMQVFGKMIDTLKTANRLNEVKPLIERARKLLGDKDLFADRQLISFYRESGMKADALAVARATRSRLPNDYGLLRLEATLLTENGKVDEGVALVKKLIGGQTAKPAVGSSKDGETTVSVTVPNYDDFSNYLFISQLYSQAGRGTEAADAANQAYTVARGAERKQIAKLTLATARQTSGDYTGAETTLREILKETPRNPIALNNLGYFLLERGERLQEAFDLIKQAVAIDPTNPSYLDSLGWAYFRLGNVADAEKNLKDAARLDVGSATIQEHLGDVYQGQGKIDLAAAAWQRALKLASENAEIERLKKKLGQAK